ncbi:MAG: TIGR03435 family protein [Candidatus Sulfopaludibacter sp.]|nr:TIGR03435 family protein [Candidatus Sulfopaludibacter sp.]
MRAFTLASTALVMAAIGAHGQPAPAFEVASVKVSPPRTGTARFTAMDSDPAMVRYSNITLKILIAVAYKFDSRLVMGGPPWLDSEVYDVVAKMPPGTPKDQVPAMLQTLLAERFMLALHPETKDQRAYFLVVGKNGPKLKPAREEGGQNQIIPGGIMGHAMTMGVLAGTVASVMGYHVVDKTGLTGAFDIDLRFTPENSKEPGPSLLTCIQEQLGLKLEPGRAPVEMLIVDRAERIPTEN